MFFMPSQSRRLYLGESEGDRRGGGVTEREGEGGRRKEGEGRREGEPFNIPIAWSM